MRIAQLSPLIESVPPKMYGGTERIVYFLTEELVRQGHKVTLFATGDSVTSAELAPCCDHALRMRKVDDPVAYHLMMLENVLRRRDEFDVIHSHLDFLPYPLFRRYPNPPAVSTLHGRLDLPELPLLYREYPEMAVVSISDSQRAPLPWANWQGTVHHGLPPDLYAFNPGPGKYLAFLGRMSPEKRPDMAISIAIRAGIPLKMAAKVGWPDEEYFHEKIKPLLSHPLVEYIGEIREHEKAEFLGNAMAMLFPLDWPEPFGLVMIESMACGTPVIALPRGAVPEVVRNGVSGFVVGNEDEAVAAVALAAGLDRAACRAHFEDYFTEKRMADDYLGIYRNLVDARRADGGSYHGRGHLLHHGEFIPGGEAESGPETW